MASSTRRMSLLQRWSWRMGTSVRVILMFVAQLSIRKTAAFAVFSIVGAVVTSYSYPIGGNGRGHCKNFLEIPNEKKDVLLAINTKKLRYPVHTSCCREVLVLSPETQFSSMTTREKNNFWGFSAIVLDLPDALQDAQLGNLHDRIWFSIIQYQIENGERIVIAGDENLDTPKAILHRGWSAKSWMDIGNRVQPSLDSWLPDLAQSVLVSLLQSFLEIPCSWCRKKSRLQRKMSFSQISLMTCVRRSMQCWVLPNRQKIHPWAMLKICIWIRSNHQDICWIWSMIHWCFRKAVTASSRYIQSHVQFIN